MSDTEPAAPKVVALFEGMPAGDGAPVAEVVAVLRQMLDEAERGELVAVSIVAVQPNGGMVRAHHIVAPHWLAMIGAMEVARIQTARNYVGDDTSSSNWVQ
jgi:hypothetical protein